MVQYHFGDREGLVRELIAFRASLSERLRVEMFADLLSRGQPRSFFERRRLACFPSLSADRILTLATRYVRVY